MLLNKQKRNLIEQISKKMSKLGLGDEKELQQELLQRYALIKSRQEMVKLG